MRILRVTRAYPPVWDGAANHVVGLSRQQARAGHRVWVLQPHMPDSSDDSSMPARLRVRLPQALERGIYESKASIAAFHLRATSLAKHIQREHGIQVLHVHGDALDAFLQGGVARQCHAPLVQTVHAGLNRRWLYRHTAPRLLRRVTRFIAVAQSVAADLVALGIPEDRIAVISSGIDARRFSGRSRAGGSQMLAIGRLHPAKGFTYLVEAMRLLAASGLTPMLTIVGVGPERESLEALAMDLPNVRFAGALAHERIPDTIAAAGLFILPSVDLDGQTEGTPTVLMEAMAAGLPIVTTDAGGSAQLIRHGVNGLVVPQRSPAALAEAIKGLLGDEAAQRRMGNLNRTVGIEKDWSVIEQRVAGEYEIALRQYADASPSVLQ
jgi:glycosyltransferase involved in cell wall biosynthesis